MVGIGALPHSAPNSGLVLMTDNTKHFPMTELARHPFPSQEIP